MCVKTTCRKCGSGLENWNNGQCLWINHCPNCGVKVLKKQREVLHGMTTTQEISDMIREHLITMLESSGGMDVSADELGSLAWESENYDGSVFYSNYRADLFVMRHINWVDEAFEYVCNELGDAEHYVKMKAECNDRFLVLAFIYATEHYVFDQLGIDRDEGDLSKKRVREIIRQIKQTEYGGGF